jgi:hypothetical protein
VPLGFFGLFRGAGKAGAGHRRPSPVLGLS